MYRQSTGVSSVGIGFGYFLGAIVFIQGEVVRFKCAIHVRPVGQSWTFQSGVRSGQSVLFAAQSPKLGF